MLLRPFLSDNLLRIGERIGQTFRPSYSKHQIILSKNHSLSALLVQDVHVKNCHSGIDLTPSLIRETFWIINAKSLIKGVVWFSLLQIPKSFTETTLNEWISHHKIIYHKWSICSYQHRLFWTTVKLNKESQQRYGAIFKCLSSLALLIELAGDMSTDSFILAPHRFISRRGYLKSITSDNDT